MPQNTHPQDLEIQFSLKRSNWRKTKEKINNELNCHTPITEFGLDQMHPFTKRSRDIQAYEAAAATFQPTNG